ncbi:hypothetical protein DL769_011056 [Monosporascus sp. CRB-8-3]|nr:hypothetical protein DL769_011056 [Monosporascus sp. CRB-8-3]
MALASMRFGMASADVRQPQPSSPLKADIPVYPFRYMNNTPRDVHYHLPEDHEAQIFQRWAHSQAADHAARQRYICLVCSGGQELESAGMPEESGHEDPYVG